jgi:hypothetical protein
MGRRKAAEERVVVVLCVSGRATVHIFRLASCGGVQLAMARKRQRVERLEKVACAFLVCFVSPACHDGHFSAVSGIPRETKWHVTLKGDDGRLSNKEK